MIVLDASVLIGHLRTQDEHHAAATRVLLDATPGALLVHPMTLAEVLVGGVRTGRGEQLRDELRAAGVGLVTVDEREPLRLAELRVASRLTLPDCCVLDAALQRRAALATFDAALATAAAERGVLVVPTYGA